MIWKIIMTLTIWPTRSLPQGATFSWATWENQVRIQHLPVITSFDCEQEKPGRPLIVDSGFSLETWCLPCPSWSSLFLIPLSLSIFPFLSSFPPFPHNIIHDTHQATIDNGFVTIRGRIKDVIITSGGKNIAPYPIEDRIKSELADFVSNCVVVGGMIISW